MAKTPTDIGKRIRARVWGTAVAHVENLSNNALDARFVLVDPGTGLDRGVSSSDTFAGIRENGAEPHEPHGPRRFSIVEAVAGVPRYTHTRAVFVTPMWRLLIPPSPTIKVVQSIIADLLDQLDLYRASDEDAEIGRLFYGNTELFEERPSAAYDEGLQLIASRPHLDNLGLLGALFREALFYRDYDRAMRLEIYLDLCLIGIPEAYGLDKELALTLNWLVHERVLRNHWEPIDDSRAIALAMQQFTNPTSDREKDERGRRVNEMARRYHFRSNEYQRPISPITKTLIEFLAHGDDYRKRLGSVSEEDIEKLFRHIRREQHK